MYWCPQRYIQYLDNEYIHRNSTVYGCFLDASKAFDLVNHKLLFGYLSDRNLPLSIIRFLMFWYEHQSMCVHWNDVFLIHFGPLMVFGKVVCCHLCFFSVYIDELLHKLKDGGVGCYMGCELLSSFTICSQNHAPYNM